MPPSNPARVLIVTDRSAATPALLGAISDRGRRGPVQFRLLVPNPAPAEWHVMHPARHDQAAEAERVLARALPEVEQAAGGSVIGSVSIRHDPMDAIEETLHDEPFDEIILCRAPHDLQRWLHIDLAHRVAHLGLPVTTITEEPVAADRG